jgi:endonuclease/exonuclease/phosphatase family metal-dependent hydrolase
VRFLRLFVAIGAVSGCAASTVAIERPAPPTTALTSCSSRTSQISWHPADPADAAELARWCRAVGPPVLSSASDAPPAPSLDELVTVSWNAHLAEGDLEDLIHALRTGQLTNGRPVTRFVLLVQELHRGSDDVPPFDPRDRSAFAIRSRERDVLDVDDRAARLGLHFLYVPSMRNGSELREDRGNAIISSEPLLDPIALELPLARQRRVALGAAIAVATPRGIERLEVINAHLEPLSSPKTLWVFQDPRGPQVRAILDLLATPRYHGAAGVVWGGDFNTVRGGEDEDAYRRARAWSSSLVREDRRTTHMMGRLDYLFFRLAPEWAATTQRLDDRFGSDHYPVLGTFTRITG